VPSIDYFLERVTNRGLPRVAGGSRTWTVLVVGAVTFRTIRRMRRASGEPLYRTAIRPGDRFEIVARDRR
jgi:hypothetical protein